MQRYLLVLVGLGRAAFIIWRPPQRSAGLAIESPPHASTGHARRTGHLFASTRTVVYVAGEVRRPGLYRLPPGSRVDDAIRQAGGMLPDADSLAVDLAQQVSDGDEVAVASQC